MRLQTEIRLRKSWSVPRDRSDDEIVFVLGAGASVDAGLPVAAKLTHHLRPELVRRVPQTAAILDAIDRVRKRDAQDALADDYEEIFWWLQTLLERKPLRTLLGIDVTDYETLFSEISGSVRDIITEYLSEKERTGSDVSYLSRIADFSHDGRAVKVFTLNYDTCVERACQGASIPIVTGFAGEDAHRRGWQPGVFEQESRRGGIHLYKLHGSLTWFGSDPNAYEDIAPPDPTRTKTRYDARPRLVLGPTTKVQPEDPFWWLLDRFHEDLKRARTCIVMGFSGRDAHVFERITHERSLGLNIIEVRPDLSSEPVPSLPGAGEFEHGVWIGIGDRCTASEALTSGRIRDEIARLPSLRVPPPES